MPGIQYSLAGQKPFSLRSGNGYNALKRFVSPLDLDRIVHETWAAWHEITPGADLAKPSPEPRVAAAYLARRILKASYPKLALGLGYKSHTTAMRQVRKADAALQEPDSEISRLIAIVLYRLDTKVPAVAQEPEPLAPLGACFAVGRHNPAARDAVAFLAETHGAELDDITHAGGYPDIQACEDAIVDISERLSLGDETVAQLLDSLLQLGAGKRLAVFRSGSKACAANWSCLSTSLNANRIANCIQLA